MYEQQPAWVETVPIPLQMKTAGTAAEVLLFTTQSRYQPGDAETFSEQAIRVNTAQGLAAAGNIILAWNPAVQSMSIHRARILRQGRWIDLLGERAAPFAVLRRETNLEAETIDGQLTATLQPEGLQIGDVLDVAYTVARHEPALGGRSEGDISVGHAGVVGRLVVRASWPDSHPFRVWKTDDLPELTQTRQGAWTEVGFDQTNVVSPEPPKGALLSDRLFGFMEVGDFADWRAVSSTAFPLYDKAATLGSTSPLQAEVARLPAVSLDPASRALAALELVQASTRYLYVALDAGATARPPPTSPGVVALATARARRCCCWRCYAGWA